MVGPAVHEKVQLVLDDRALHAGLDVPGAEGIHVADVIKGLVVRAEVVPRVRGHGSAGPVGPFLGRDVHDARHGLPVFGVERAADHLELLHHLLVDVHHRAPVVHVRHGNAVDPESDLALAPAARVQVAARVLDQSRLKLDSLGHLGHGQGSHFFGADHGCGGREILDHHGPNGHDGDALADVHHRGLELEIDLGGQVDGHPDILHARVLVPEQAAPQHVRPRRQIQYQVVPVILGHPAVGRAFDEHGRARQRRSGGGVRHDAGEFSRRARECGRRGQDDQRSQDEQTDDFHAEVPRMKR